MATCERVKAHLNDFLDGTLGAADAQDLNIHVQECGVCRAEYRALKATLELLRDRPVPDGHGARQRVMVRFRQAVAPTPALQPASTRFNLPVWRTRLVPLSAAGVMTVALLFLIGLPQLRHTGEPIASPAGPIILATAACTTTLPTANDLDQMVSAHAVQSFTVQNGSEEPQQEALADANSRLR